MIQIDKPTEQLLRYSELSTEDKVYICNGCGGKGGWFNPPEFLFHASCNQHDFYYWRGGTEDDRLIADKAFYTFMKEDASEASWYDKPLHYIMAYVYYKAVRFSGKKFFNYEQVKGRAQLENEKRLNS